MRDKIASLMRESSGHKSVKLQSRDFAFLQGLFESRVMTLAHAAALFFDGKPEAAKKRVQKLKAAGCVRERPRQTYEPSVLFLTAGAFTLLSQHGKLAAFPAVSLTSWEKRAQVSDLTLRHELEVMDVKAALVSAIANTRQLRVAEFSTWPTLSQFHACRPDNHVEVVVNPDGFMRVHEEGADGQFEHAFFLEVDRSTESQEVLAIKAACYGDYYRRGGFALRQGGERANYADYPFRVPAALDTVDALRRGREGARETEPVRPVPVGHAEAVLPFVSAQVAAMIRLQLLTGMRPGEVVIMRGIDLDTSGPVWAYTPSKHKTGSHGYGRTVYIGPRAQEAIRPFLKPDLTAYLFSAADADRARRAARSAARTTPLSCGNKPGSNRGRQPRRTPGDRYKVRSYYRAIEKACEKAFPAPPELADQPAELLAWRKAHRWHPHQLRHTAGTTYRREADFEAAKIILGHRTDSMTQLYAERDEQKAQEVVARIG
jgi:integrase